MTLLKCAVSKMEPPLQFFESEKNKVNVLNWFFIVKTDLSNGGKNIGHLGHVRHGRLLVPQHLQHLLPAPFLHVLGQLFKLKILSFAKTWLIERKRTAHFIVVDDVSVPAEKKSKMMLQYIRSKKIDTKHLQSSSKVKSLGFFSISAR